MEDLDINSMEQELSPAKKFSEDDTHAVRDLKTALQKNLYRKYLSMLGIPDNRIIKDYIYYYINGTNSSIGPQYVFMCREKLQPSKWYYRHDEELPKRIEFKPKYTWECMRTMETEGLRKLVELRKIHTAKGLEEKFGISFYQIKNILYKRHDPISGKEIYKIFPQKELIIKLREVINPDYWFIFPEELV